MNEPQQTNDFLRAITRMDSMVLIQLGMFMQTMNVTTASAAIASERAAIAKLLEELATEHSTDDDQQSRVAAMVYRDAAEKVRSRG